jgi:hypothetical protein
MREVVGEKQEMHLAEDNTRAGSDRPIAGARASRTPTTVELLSPGSMIESRPTNQNPLGRLSAATAAR